MALRIEDYAVIGDTRTAALVGFDGSIDWLCLPRFDSAACFSALLGEPEHGRWQLAPAGDCRPLGRRYRGDTLVLETEFGTDDGIVRVVDAMPIEDRHPGVVRVVEGVQGRVAMRSDLRMRFDYGRVSPWLRADGRRLRAFAGPDAVMLEGDVVHQVVDGAAAAEFSVGAGEQVAFVLSWTGLEQPGHKRLDGAAAVRATEKWWTDWAGRCTYAGEYREAVVRSLITLKALSYSPSGGIVAAVTTSLPEQLGGVRNWDYRYCWLRDATFTLLALLDAGYADEAVAWREWLLRALAGDPRQLQIMYGVAGERRTTEIELDWLPGYADSRPVRAGNAASGQFQLDVYGEVMDALHQARSHGIPPEDDAWEMQRVLMDSLESRWREPDNGIWEMRGPRREFVHSKVMAWAGLDRAVKAAEAFSLDGPVERWRRTRQEIFDEVCERGFDRRRGTFTQYYGSKELDGALLLLAPTGFLPATDERITGTVAAIERDLCADGFVQRYRSSAKTSRVDGLPPGEGAFLACTFWLADNYELQGRSDDARALFERLLALRNDVGLLSEEYDVGAGRLVGNFPQAFSHVPLVNTAFGLAGRAGPVRRRSGTGPAHRSGGHSSKAGRR